MKRLQPQYSEQDRKKEINRYVKQDTLIHLIIIVTVVCALLIWGAVVNSEEIDKLFG